MMLSLFCLQSIVAVCCVIGSGESIKDRELGSSHTGGIITGWLVSSRSLLSLSLSPSCEPCPYINTHSVCHIVESTPKKTEEEKKNKLLCPWILALFTSSFSGACLKHLCLLDSERVQLLFTDVCVLIYNSSLRRTQETAASKKSWPPSHRQFIPVPVEHF